MTIDRKVKLSVQTYSQLLSKINFKSYTVSRINQEYLRLIVKVFQHLKKSDQLHRMEGLLADCKLYKNVLRTPSSITLNFCVGTPSESIIPDPGKPLMKGSFIMVRQVDAIFSFILSANFD